MAANDSSRALPADLEQRACEMLTEALRSIGEHRMADNFERGQHPIIITSQAALRAIVRALSSPTMTEGVHPVFAYLLGEGALEGHWFGDWLPFEGDRTKSAFWWRKHLREALSIPPSTVRDGLRTTVAQVIFDYQRQAGLNEEEAAEDANGMTAEIVPAVLNVLTPVTVRDDELRAALERAKPLFGARKSNRPIQRGERLVGFILDEEAAGLSDGLFMLDALLLLARAALSNPTGDPR